MSTVYDTAISGINAMKIIIDHTVKKAQNPHKNNINTRIFVENSINESNPSAISLKVKEIYDDYNDFMTEEQRKTDTQIKNEESKIEQLVKLEDLLCEKSNVFDELISNLYHEMTKDTTSDNNNKINENIKNKLSDIAFSIKDFDKKLSFLEKDVKASIMDKINKANELIDAIHDITIDIRYFPIARMHNTINGLIDQREKLVDELNSLIGVKVIKNNDHYAVYLNNGISLIDDNQKQNLMPLISKIDDKYISVGYADNQYSMPKKIENMIPSGILGSLLQFRKEELAKTRNKIGQLAVDFSDTINQYARLGYIFFENQEKNIFEFSPPEVIQSSTNTSSTQTSIKWKDASKPRDTDYIIYFKNNVWTVRRLSDQSIAEHHISQDNDITCINFDGIELFIKGQHADGDIYMIKPYSKTLETFQLLINTNNPLSVSSINYDNNQHNKTVNQFNDNQLVDSQTRLDESYQKFSKSISYRYHLLEENLPFKKSMIKILENKKMTISNNDIDSDFNNLSYEQACYLANVKVLETAEKIFNEIIDSYS